MEIKTDQRGGHPRFYEIVNEIVELHSRKNTDYAKGMRDGALGNFVRVSSIMKLYPGLDWSSPFGIAICYLLKQFDAALVLRATKRESLTGEPVGSRLMDMAVYSLLGIILEEEEQACK